MSELDWNAIGTAAATIVLTLGTAAGGAYAWWLDRGKKAAKARAEVAESNAGVAEANALGAVADAQQAVYRLMQDRLTTLEADMRAVREELNVERKHSRKLELHIFRLESLMRKAGLEPPAMEGDH